MSTETRADFTSTITAPTPYSAEVEAMRIGDKMSDAAQALIDHSKAPALPEDYDHYMHRLELQAAVEAWLEFRRNLGPRSE